LSFGKDADRVREAAPAAVLATTVSEGRAGCLHDALYDERACAALLAFIEQAKQARAKNGIVRGEPGAEFQAIRGPAQSALPLRRGPRGTERQCVVFMTTGSV
jgi:hypothetical protein